MGTLPSYCWKVVQLLLHSARAVQMLPTPQSCGEVLPGLSDLKFDKAGDRHGKVYEGRWMRGRVLLGYWGDQDDLRCR